MKRFLTYIFSTALVLTFLVVTTLAMVCAYHHGIDGLDHRSQSNSHTTLFCPSLSKVSGLVLMIASGFSGFTLEDQQRDLVQPSFSFSSSFGENPPARSPPSTILS